MLAKISRYTVFFNSYIMQAINYNKYSTASDVWSFGCVMYEIWSLGHRPFADLSNDEVAMGVLKHYPRS